MRKGFYFIGTNQTDKNGEHFHGPEIEEGSIERRGRLFIHRKKDHQWNPNKWKLSHEATGANILCDLDLKSARLLIGLLQPFKIWDITEFKEIQQTILDAKDNPKSPYHQEYIEIMEIRHERA